MFVDRTISVTGEATCLRRPSFALLVGLLESADTTLRTAIEKLAAKREAAEGWLKRLDATEVGFVEPRFPDQVDLDPLAAAHKRQSELMGRGPKKEPASVQMRFTALWSLEGMSPEDTLIFADRILFEAREPEDDESGNGQLDPSEIESPEDVSRYMADMVQRLHAGSGSATRHQNMHLLFLSRLEEQAQATLLREAVDDARAKAGELAQASDCKLGPLESIRESIFRQYQPPDWTHRSPFLQEIPYGKSQWEELSLGSREVQFRRAVDVSFSIEQD